MKRKSSTVTQNSTRLAAILGMGVMWATPPAQAVPLTYTYAGQFLAGGGNFLNAMAIDGKNFAVSIFADTAAPDGDPGDVNRGLFLGLFAAQINIDGVGIFTFANSIASISEDVDAPAGPLVQSTALFGGGSTSLLQALSNDTISPFFGNPNVLNPFPGGASVVTARFDAEQVIRLGTTEVFSLTGRSGGGTVNATTTSVPDSGSTLWLFAGALTGLGGLALLRRRDEAAGGDLV